MGIAGVKDIKIEVEEGSLEGYSGSAAKGKRMRRRRTAINCMGPRGPRTSSDGSSGCREVQGQFRWPFTANLDAVKAHLGNDVLKVAIPKLADRKTRQPKIIEIMEDRSVGDMTAPKADL
ncbi:hypothetical protein EJ110_NYTH34060 [Nymphaea thermarum]|nr:hypothetical protein EJ110_NYTH34060 [Nymphaea thermarum]